MPVDGGWPPPIVFVVPGAIDTRTGGSIYDARIAEGLRRHGAHVEIVELAGAFPNLGGKDLRAAAAALSRITDGRLVVIDGLALSAMPDVVEREADRLRLVALIHLPVGADVALEPSTSARLREQEQRALATTRRVIVTSPATVTMLRSYDLPPDSIRIVEPGTDRAPLARGSGGPRVHLVCVATVNAGKGHDILVRALARIREHDWSLTCAGSLTRDPAASDRVRREIADLRLDDRVSLAGELDADAIAACYDRADVFVLATLQETYGMAVAEALAHGLPVVSTVTGAIPSLVGSDGGILVPAGDTGALAEALLQVIGDASLRAKLADGARRIRERLPTWDDACATFAAALAHIR